MATPAAARKIAPGPPGQPLLGNLNEIRKDILRFLLDVRREYGDVARVKLGPQVLHLVSHPAWIRYVLATHQANYHKSAEYRAIEPLVGRGLVTSEGELWTHQRKLIQPGFHLDRIRAFGTLMTDAAQAMLARWQGHAESDQPFDVAPEMAHLTMIVAGRAMFTREVAEEARQVGEALTVALRHAGQAMQSPFPLPDFLPTPSNRRFHSAIRALDRIVYRMIDERRRSGEDTGDLLSMLMLARDAETGETMSDQQLRDEVMTLFIAGHETTANLLTWAWYLLAKSPPAERRLRAELDAALGGRAPTVDDLPKLPYTLMVLQETMRLYPPAWIISRTPLADDEIAGYHIPAGSTVMMSQYVTHRHPDFWEQPEGFDPERFASHPPAAYFPFGGGPRTCIGNNFALLEARLVLATVAQRYHLELLPGHPVEPESVVTLRPRHGVQVSLRPYQPAPPRQPEPASPSPAEIITGQV
jgi:cytochrome P450